MLYNVSGSYISFMSLIFLYLLIGIVILDNVLEKSKLWTKLISLIMYLAMYCMLMSDMPGYELR